MYGAIWPPAKLFDVRLFDVQCDSKSAEPGQGMNLWLTCVSRCGYDQQGALAHSPASTDGVLGLSNSKVALSSQLAEQGIINNVIGHCLAGGSNGGGYLFFGDELVPSWGMTWAPLLGRPAM